MSFEACVMRYDFEYDFLFHSHRWLVARVVADREPECKKKKKKKFWLNSRASAKSFLASIIVFMWS